MGFSYGTEVTVTVTALQSLASSSGGTAGWTSASVDNTSTLAVDYLVSAQFALNTGAAPTDATTISVYAYAVHLRTGPTWPTLFSSGTAGSQGAASVTDTEERDNGMRLLWRAQVDASTSAVHVMPPTGIAQAFGGIVPPLWALWVTQGTGQALNSSGNAVYYTPILWT